MAKQSDWNKSFWRKLNKLEHIDEKAISHIIRDEVNKVGAIMESKTPVKYGGLKFSKYAVVEQTPTGYAGRVGYVNQPHISLDPSDPGYDNFTNPELLEMLENSEKVSNDVLDIADAIYDFRDNCASRIKDYWKGVIHD